MRKFLLIGAVALASFINAQTTVFSADFESAAGWGVIDRDGDGQQFGIFNLTAPLNGFPIGKSAGSRSWSSALGALTPDNLLLSPDIVLPNTGTLKLSLLVGATDVNFYEEHYAVYALPTGTVFTGTETALIEETLTSATAKTVTVDLTGYAGQTVKLFFRHFNCTDQNIFLFDDVLVTQTIGMGTANNSTTASVSLYPNPTSDFLNFSGKVSSVQIFDASGRTVSSSKVSNNQVNVTNLEKGVYIVKFETENGTQTEKFIKK